MEMYNDWVALVDASGLNKEVLNKLIQEAQQFYDPYADGLELNEFEKDEEKEKNKFSKYLKGVSPQTKSVKKLSNYIEWRNKNMHKFND